MDEIREKIQRLERELADLKQQAKRTTLKPYLNGEMFDVHPVSCLGHTAKAKDGKKVYIVDEHGGNYTPLYDFAKKLFKFKKIGDLSHDEAKEIADFCNEIIPIFNKYVVDKYVVNSNIQRVEEAYQDILEYLRATGETGAIVTWENQRNINVKHMAELKKEFSDV